MILQELRALALREGLVDDPAFESKPVAWIIQLDADGGYLGLKSTRVEVAPPEGKKGKPRLQAAMHSIPRRQGRTVNDLADFLVDKSEYVLGVEPDGKRAAAALEKRRKLFAQCIGQASAETKSPVATAITRFLADQSARDRCVADLEQVGYAGNDLFTFATVGKLAHLDDALRRWWVGPPVVDGAPGQGRQCLLCGEVKPPVDKHGALLVPGGVTSGVSLVTFNSAAFEKHGLERNDNAPICRECMTAYFEGLRRLISPRYVNARTGEVVVPQNTRLSDDTTAVYWSAIDDPLLGILGELLYSPQQVRDLLQSPHRGQRGQVAEGRFFCLILSGAQGRAMLRTLHTGTLSELERNLKSFFEAAKLAGRDDARPQGLGGLLRSLVLDGKLDRLPPRLAEEVFLGVLFGSPLPRLVLASAAARNRAEQHVSPERAALLQIFFNSRNHLEVPLVSLNETSTLPAYRLGRLLAAFERVQTDAQGRNLNRTLVDRYFGAASTRPGTVFPQLVRLSQTHLGKLGEQGAYLKRLVGEITDGLAAFPAMLTLEEQGHFALGYYHQRQRFFRKPAAEPEANQPELALQGDPA